MAGSASMAHRPSADDVLGCAAPPSAKTLLAGRPSAQAQMRSFRNGMTGPLATAQARSTGQYSQAVSSQRVDVPVGPNCLASACQ